MYTSYFANPQFKGEKSHQEYHLVSIARKTPNWVRISEKCLWLAPTKEMLERAKSGDQAFYDRGFAEILAKAPLGDLVQRWRYVEEHQRKKVVLLCWEKNRDSCHRKRVAEEMERRYNIPVEELCN